MITPSKETGTLRQSVDGQGANARALGVLGSTALIIYSMLPAFWTVTKLPPRFPTEELLSASVSGYTQSNYIWGIPVLFMGAYLMMCHLPSMSSERKSALWDCLVKLPILGFVLDLVSAERFFTFVNTTAVGDVTVPAFDVDTGRFSGSFPVEELIFYILGFAFVILAYVLASERFLRAYHLECHPGRTIHWNRDAVRGLGVALLFVLVGSFTKYHMTGSWSLPEYLTFLSFASVGLIAFLWNAAAPFVNWQALALVSAVVLCISIVWEVTLAGPYQWWGYHDRGLMGVRISAWYGLPLEAVLVWFLVTPTCAFTYEALTSVQFASKPSQTARTSGKAFTLCQKAAPSA